MIPSGIVGLDVVNYWQNAISGISKYVSSAQSQLTGSETNTNSDLLSSISKTVSAVGTGVQTAGISTLLISGIVAYMLLKQR